MKDINIENDGKDDFVSFWIAPADEKAKEILYGIEGIFRHIMEQHKTFIGELNEDSYHPIFSLDLRMFSSPEKMNACTIKNEFCGTQCIVKCDEINSNQCVIDFVYNFPTGKHTNIIVKENAHLNFILEDLLVSLFLPGLIGFDYADFTNMISKSSDIEAYSIFNIDSTKEESIHRPEEDKSNNLVVLFSFLKNDNRNFLEEVSQWVMSNTDDNMFNVVVFSCVLRNRGHDPDRKTIFIGKNIGGSDGHL
jgi:hypothetical protein